MFRKVGVDMIITIKTLPDDQIHIQRLIEEIELNDFQKIKEPCRDSSMIYACYR